MWHQMVGAFRNAIDATAVSVYVGPGDIYGAAIVFYALRGFSAAYSTGSNPAIDVVDTATGLITTTVNIKSDGSLDSATVLGLGYAVSIKKFYDQSGNGRHATQATLSKMPTLNISGIGSLPGAVFTSAAASEMDSGSSTLPSAPYGFSAVYNCTSTTSKNFLIDDANGHGLTHSSANRATLNPGFDATANDSAFHRVQAVSKGAGSSIYVDAGASNPTGTSSITWAGANILHIGFAGIDMTLGEIGAWNTDFAAQFASVDTNQQTYWSI